MTVGVDTSLQVRSIDAGEVRQLRHEVLRPHQPASAAVYERDHEPLTCHVGAFEDGVLVSVGSIFHEARDAESRGEWRIRGMATLERARGKGAGSLVLRELLSHAEASGCTKVWLNARPRAIPFYRRGGFEVVGAEFELEGIGKHVTMERACRERR